MSELFVENGLTRFFWWLMAVGTFGLVAAWLEYPNWLFRDRLRIFSNNENTLNAGLKYGKG